MGSNLIQVMTYGRGTGGTRDVDVEDLYELVDKYPQYLTGVTPMSPLLPRCATRRMTMTAPRSTASARRSSRRTPRAPCRGDSCGGPLPQLHRRGSASECVRHRRLSGGDGLSGGRAGQDHLSERCALYRHRRVEEKRRQQRGQRRRCDSTSPMKTPSGWAPAP